ncbi:glycosyltransferase family 4 protein [Spongiivirga sp. MCCC 1A20706]|uniref:glycosyltransferase family 4 protein n=1 Tax=Spongiivirga sp. MCCC 1A20706 TaxID=3160963 RepID=UPI00397767E1
MKIVTLLSRIDQTGMTTNTLDLAQGMIKDGHEVYVITGGQVEKNNLRLDGLLQEFLDAGVVVKKFTIPHGGKVKRIFLSFTSVIKILYLIIALKPDVIHSQSPYMSFLPWLLGKKFTSTFHVNDFVKSFRYKKASHLIAISKETKEYAIKLFDYNPKNITIVNHGVSKEYSAAMDVKAKDDFKKKNNIPLDKIIIGFVGSIEKRKGHDVLLEAVSKLNEDAKSKIHLIFLGSSKHQDNRPWLENLIDQTKTAEMVTLFEYQNPKPFYQIYDVFVLPSRLEGFPLVVIEAMMSECCVIRSNVQGAYDQIDDGKDGFIFENENSQELTTILNNVIHNNKLRVNVAKAGKEKALNRFTIEEMTKGTLEVYKKVKI